MQTSPIFRILAYCSFMLGLALTSTAAAQIANPGLVSSARLTQGEQDAYKELTGLARAEREAATLTAHGMPAVALEGELRDYVSSRKAKPGDEVLLSLVKNATLPDGTVLLRGSVVHGKVVQAAAHTKTYKNGAVLIAFDRIAPRQGDAFPLFALMSVIAPSTEETSGVNGAIHHGTIGATSNSPNAPILQRGGLGDAIIGENAATSGIPGVMLVASAGGSGILLAPNDDATMERAQIMMLVAGKASATLTTQRAFAILHPKTASAAAVPVKK